MTEVQLERAFRRLFSEEKTRKFSICLKDHPSHVFDESVEDGNEEHVVEVDFHLRELSIVTWNVSHHNGDAYGEKRYRVPWEKVSLLGERVLHRLVLLEENRQVEDLRKKEQERKLLRQLEIEKSIREELEKEGQ